MLIKDKIKVGSFELRNRMVKAPIHSETCVDGKVTPETEQHYEERTKGGRFGLVVVEHSFVRKDGMASPTQLSSSRDSDIDGLKESVISSIKTEALLSCRSVMQAVEQAEISPGSSRSVHPISV